MPDGTQSRKLLENVQAAGAAAAVRAPDGNRTYQAWGATTSGSGSATIQIQGTNNGGITWDTIGTITLTLGASATSDSFSSLDRFTMLRGNVTALSGTGAAVSAEASGG
jgi:hypothetical protein